MVVASIVRQMLLYGGRLSGVDMRVSRRAEVFRSLPEDISGAGINHVMLPENVITGRVQSARCFQIEYGGSTGDYLIGDKEL